MKHSVLLTLAIIISTLCSNAQSLYVSSMKGNVNLRTAPSTTSAKAGTLKSTDLLPCIEELDDWYKVSYNGKEAYVSKYSGFRHKGATFSTLHSHSCWFRGV